VKGSVRNSALPSYAFTHEFLNRLGIIIGYCDLLNENVEQDSESARYISQIRDAANSMTARLTKKMRAN
jgi:hypothetical protein